ncbi:MAG TPA: hypothetical protein PKI20_07640 [Verrucomicrobiota bacterium]|jgi:hypothetical protein|nr:hypothetical protein [Verrucomicrobiota bacterium]HQL77595.1 hypothetical protein [Verrucomicrobiota bacterium]
MARIIVIRKSLAAFVCGLFGFLPFVGLVPGLYALFCWARIRARYPDEWNPAAAYLSWGARLSLLGLLGTALIVSVMLVQTL